VLLLLLLLPPLLQRYFCSTTTAIPAVLLLLLLLLLHTSYRLKFKAASRGFIATARLSCSNKNVFTVRRYALHGLSYRNSVRPSVSLSVTLVHCLHVVQPTIMIFSPYGSHIILVSEISSSSQNSKGIILVSEISSSSQNSKGITPSEGVE